jgi:hypothetical protein
MTALIEGFFAAMWLGWARTGEHGPDVWLTIGQIFAVIVAIGGLVLALRGRSGTSAFDDPRIARRYWALVAVEFTIAGLGALVLGTTGAGDFIVVWVSAVVAVHFFPLARILGSRTLPTLGALMCAVAVTALATRIGLGTPATTVAGTGCGVLLLAFGALALAGVGAGQTEPMPVRRDFVNV